ncbi:mannose-specific lectin CEA-like [Dioscorea cayenensis subsp. rotundata]|uniref:Mannose-specific lectin CEA-like n=1 Tax=Dioscorea cayennensis subsp. rotundata TaxID=55577 RepID=A0AB40BXR2_DIOCR|nr:mannose-specific lectin CEA-like [Dioscorea cayenensis subsp. rotundata]
MAIQSLIPNLLLLLLLPALPFSLSDYVLYSGEVLTPGQNLTNGDFQLSLQPNCELIITDAVKTIWRANTSGQGSDCYLGFKHNGELVVRHGVHYILWSSGVKSKKGKYALLLDSNGKLNIFGQRRWISNNQKVLGENNMRTVITTEYVLHSGHRLNPGKHLSYQNLTFGLSHCNLVINDTDSGRILWQTNTKARGCYVQLDANGELTVKHSKQRLWSSNKRGDNGAYIGVLRYDGRFGVYGPLLWDSDKKDTVDALDFNGGFVGDDDDDVQVL